MVIPSSLSPGSRQNGHRCVSRARLAAVPSLQPAPPAAPRSPPGRETPDGNSTPAYVTMPLGLSPQAAIAPPRESQSPQPRASVGCCGGCRYPKAQPGQRETRLCTQPAGWERGAQRPLPRDNGFDTLSSALPACSPEPSQAHLAKEALKVRANVELSVTHKSPLP